MNGNNGIDAVISDLGERLSIKVPSRRVDINEDRGCTLELNDVSSCDMCHRRDDDPVPRSDASGKQRKMQTSRTT